MKLELRISKNDAGRILKYVLRDRFRLSTAQLRRAKAEGEILLNGESVFVTVTVSEGDLVELHFPAETADYPAEAGSLAVLWEDEYFLAANKPAGMFTHPTPGRLSGTRANFALHHRLENGGAGCHAVNRLDRDTSGIVLFAKSSYAKSIATGLSYEKLYLAAVFGSPEADSGAIDLPIKRADERDMRRVTAPDGSPALTRYTVLRRTGEFSLLRLNLETGRTHQIRVHMAAIGHPLLGDRLYCSPASAALSQRLGVPRQLLHAESLRFPHPITGMEIDLSCPPPPDFLLL